MQQHQKSGNSGEKLRDDVLLHLEGSSHPPTCYSQHLIEAMDSGKLLQGWMQLPSKERRSRLSSSKSRTIEHAPRFLYKYRAVDPDSEDSIQKLRSILVDSRVWMASPSSLNDPQDLDFTFVDNRNPQDRRRWSKEAVSSLPPMNPVERLQLGRKIERARMTREQIAEFKKTQRLEIGVFCASQNPRNVLMWTHYADESRGVTVQYATYEDQLFLIAKPVDYSETFPTVTLPKPRASEAEHYLVKASSWSYEAEWRVVTPTPNSFVQLNPRAVAGVIFGSRASEETRICVARLSAERVDKGKPPLATYESAYRSGRFGLSIYRCS